MQDKLIMFVAAFFRNKGKSVITEKEFLMGVSMDLRWMPYKDAEEILKVLISRAVLEKSGEYLKPNFNESEIDVPVAYKPSTDLLDFIKIESPKAKENQPLPPDMFHTLIELANESGLPKKFPALCNNVQKKMNIDIEVAGLIVLKEYGVDVSKYIDATYSIVSSK